MVIKMIKQTNLKNADAVVVFIAGQSNATAHNQVLNEQDRINTPLQHVFSLDRQPNQSLSSTDIVRSGFTSKKLVNKILSCGKELHI